MKNILILFNGLSEKSPKRGSLGYDALYKYFAKNNITLCRSPIAYYSPKTSKFKKAQFFTGDTWLWKKDITPDIIYDKSRYHITDSEIKTRKLIESTYTFYNSLKLSEIMSDKSLTYKFFEEFSAKSVIINNKKECNKVEQLETSQIIIKPLSLSGGEGVFITKKETAQNVLENNIFPIIAQEFINSTKSHNDFIDGCNDIRVIIRNAKPFYAFARIPQNGKLIANVSQGATLNVIPIDTLMSDTHVRHFIEKIILKVEKIDQNKKLYAIDFMFDDNNKIWLIEMNSRPGLILEESESDYQNTFYENLVTFFK